MSSDLPPGSGRNPAAPSGEVLGLTDHLFRHEAGKLVSVLTGIFGIDRLQLAEDVVQEALVRALKDWSFYGLPENPPAWLTQTAKNLALDAIRREKNFQEKQPQIIATIENWNTDPEALEEPRFEAEIRDQRLRLMFACCHPQLPLDDQTALALKTLCGFSPAEIARAFLTTEAAIAKRLTRARQRIRELSIPFEIPAGEELSDRLSAVLRTLYLLFNEGYKASSGQRLIREDLCHEAIRLATLLVEHSQTESPRCHALFALMLFNAARLPGRQDDRGNILRLKDQDRSLWDQQLIGRGILALGRSASGTEMTEYHLQAAIASFHCTATDYASTDWQAILALYDRWMRLNDSPVVALNRAVAVAQLEGPAAGARAVDSIRDLESLKSYYLLYAVLGEFAAERGDAEQAATHWRRAIDLTDLPSEKTFLSARLATLENAPA